ncbi:MAG: hypothetical protein PHQ12_06520 [Chthoniobacteraceae bacterium]|nr:hypothetical protein [Chthoniobacteraceae bacterium]
MISIPSLRPVLAALLLFPLAACQTAREFPAPGSHWKNAQGQLQYRTPKRSVIGETVLSGNGTQDFQLDYMAGPGVPLMRLREAGQVARMEGIFAGGSWQGDPAHAHGRLASWAALREVFAALETKIDAPSATLHSAPGAAYPWTAQLNQAPGQPQRIRIEFPRTKERFMFVLLR